MALARDEQAVARPGGVEREADGPAAVVDEGDLFGRGDAVLHVREDLRERLAARVVGRGPREIRLFLHRPVMRGRLVRSRLPPQPKTTSRRPGVTARTQAMITPCRSGAELATS